MATYINPSAIKDGTISASKTDETIATKGELTELSLKVGEFKVKDASVSGNTLNITKEDGTILPFTPQGEDNTLRRDLGKYTSNEQYAAISVAQSGKAINANGEIINKSGYGISNEIAVTKGSVYIFKSNSDIADVALFTQKIVADIVYNTTEEKITTAGGEAITRIKTKSTAKGGDLKSHTYEYVYNTGNETAVWDDIKDNDVAKGASFVLPTQYIEYIPMFSANGVAARPISGHYCLASSVSGIMVISAKSEDLTGYLIEVRYGVVASIVNNLARKADVEVVSGLYKRGVISQTQTWANDYSGYKMSNLVWGTIPQANIDLFISAGAEFNNTDSPITKTAPWGEQVQHLPGYFYLNGLGDISYNEMMEIWKSRKYGPIELNQIYSNARTNFRIRLKYTGWGLAYSANDSFCESHIEVAELRSKIETMPIDVESMSSAFYNSSVVRIIGDLKVGQVTSFVSTFSYCRALKYVRLIDLKASVPFVKSALLENASILYMIQNEAATSAITITLHADAYARAMADADIIAALEQHTNISLASA